MKRSEIDRSKLSPMMKHYVELKDKYEDTIILYRLGDFYEMFFEDAEEVAHALELTLTGKSAGLDERVPMCGIPHHAAEVYIDKLIKKGYKVAICEQLEDPKTAKGIVKRDIVEVISSGTVINTNSLNEKENNYIGCLYDFSYGFVLTYSDITTGEVYSELLTNNTDDVIYKILSLDIKELIVNELINKVLLSKIRSLKIPVTIQNELLNDKYQNIYQNISDARIVNSIKLLLYYLDVLQKRNLSHFQEVVIKEKEQYLEMDIHTKRNLELTECLRTKERTYSLLWLLDNTKTAMGSRKLKYFIENPLLDINKINKRYDIVSKLLEEFILAEELRNDLYEVYDLERLCGKLSFGSANGKDLLQLKASLKVLPSIKEKLEKIGFYEKITTMSDLYDLLEKSIYEEPPNTIKEGYLIKDGYSSELDELKDLSRGGKDFISRFETEERERTGIKGLKVGFNKVFGYYIEISKSYLNMVTDDMGYIRKQTLANCERFINPILKEKYNYEDTVTFVNAYLDKDYYSNDIPLSKDKASKLDVIVNKYYKLDKDYEPEDLTVINSKFASGTQKLRKEAADKFEEMASDMLKENLKIYAGSTYRSYSYQEGLYNRYVKKDGFKEAETYSARAGYSEHQLGLAVDIVNGKWNYLSEGDKEYTWLINNSYKYGFILRYPHESEYITGYVFEDWHFRYLGIELATKVHESKLTYDEYIARGMLKEK